MPQVTSDNVAAGFVSYCSTGPAAIIGLFPGGISYARPPISPQSAPANEPINSNTKYPLMRLKVVELDPETWSNGYYLGKYTVTLEAVANNDNPDTDRLVGAIKNLFSDCQMQRGGVPNIIVPNADSVLRVRPVSPGESLEYENNTRAGVNVVIGRASWEVQLQAHYGA